MTTVVQWRSPSRCVFQQVGKRNLFAAWKGVGLFVAWKEVGVKVNQFVYGKEVRVKQFLARKVCVCAAGAQKGDEVVRRSSLAGTDPVG